MKKLFISLPMSGRSGAEICAEMNDLKEYAEDIMGEPLELIKSYFDGGADNPLRFIGESITVMSDANVILFAEGWENAKGCGIEHRCAEMYSTATIIYDERLVRSREALAPCPFCGHDDALYLRINREFSRVEIGCAVCRVQKLRAYHGDAGDITEAVDRWNRRISSAN